MEKLIIICTVLIILTGAIAGALDAIHTHYQKKYIAIMKIQNDVMKENIEIDRQIFEVFTEILKNSEEKSHE